MVDKLGGTEKTLRAVLCELSGKVGPNEIFENVIVNVAGFEIFIRGRMIDGIPKIGTMFIKEY